MAADYDNAECVTHLKCDTGNHNELQLQFIRLFISVKWACLFVSMLLFLSCATDSDRHFSSFPTCATHLAAQQQCSLDSTTFPLPLAQLIPEMIPEMISLHSSRNESDEYEIIFISIDSDLNFP